MEKELKKGHLNLITDIPGLYVGNAADEEKKTGVTILIGDKPLTAGVHIMGGSPGTRETDLLSPDKMIQRVDAFVLAGGSVFGLDAASGVADILRKNDKGYPTSAFPIPIVPGAILFDLNNGGNKNWQINPYRELGRKAYKNATANFKIGSEGAGYGANTLDLKGGLGSASLLLQNEIRVGALVAVNSVGSTIVNNSKNFWGAPFELDNEFGGHGLAKDFSNLEFGWENFEPFKGHSTTIGIVATNAKIDQAQATRVAIAAHDGIARSIYPSHTPFDGDLIFAASTNQIELAESALDLMKIGHAAANCLTRAISRAIFSAKSENSDILPSWSTKFNP